jgi:hypothetical protein
MQKTRCGLRFLGGKWVLWSTFCVGAPTAKTKCLADARIYGGSKVVSQHFVA